MRRGLDYHHIINLDGLAWMLKRLGLMESRETIHLADRIKNKALWLYDVQDGWRGSEDD